MNRSVSAIADRRVSLTFDPANLTVGEDFDLRGGLSAVAMDGDRLWLACDEGCRLERLSADGRGGFAAHQSFRLADFLRLPADPDKEEADIEGLDIEDGYLWLIGSHSLKRKKPKAGKLKPADVSARLAQTERDGNRHLLARIPLESGTPRALAGARRAGSIATSATSSALLDAIVGSADPHLAPFVQVPGKDNGFDIEGLAVSGLRAFVGLRGPVLREWCCIIEVHLEAADDGQLSIAPLGAAPYRKHFLNLNGLGVRDLAWVEDDLLVLAGPAMAHDGPSEVWRWRQALRSSDEPIEASRLLVLPDAEGNDRAEGMAVTEHNGAPALLIAFDSPAPHRLPDERSLIVDIFRL